MKIVLNKSHLNVHGKKKEVNDLTLVDFKLPMYYAQMAHKILYIQGNRCRVLKERFPTAYSLSKTKR